MSSVGCDSLKWQSWNEVVRNASDRPTYEGAVARRVCVPLAAALLSAIALVVLYPPFACTPSTGVQQPRLSAARVLCWAGIAAVATAVLSQTHLFRRGA